MPIRKQERPVLIEKRMNQAAIVQMSIEEALRNKIGEPLRPLEVDHLMDMVRKHARLWSGHQWRKGFVKGARCSEQQGKRNSQ